MPFVNNLTLSNYSFILLLKTITDKDLSESPFLINVKISMRLKVF